MARNPQPEDQLGPRRNFSVRLPEALYQQLEALAAARGESMNKVVGTAVALLLNRPDLSPSAAPGDIGFQIARDAIRQGPEAIAPLKGIAKHASNLDQIALACVLWAAAARLVGATSGAEAASQELAHSASVAEKSNRSELSVALYEEALRLDPNNLEAANRLGQRLHHLAQQSGDDVERYRRAEQHLSRVTFVDDHAKLFHGWSALYVARADRDRSKEERAIAEIDEAMRRWAFGQRDGTERTSWLRQVQRLRDAGLGTHASALIEFANRNARWDPIEP